MNQPDFLAAVGRGDAPAVATMLAADPGLAAPHPGTAADPVALAARHGHLAVLRLLLEHGADPALRDPAGRTAADHATDAGHADLARRLATDTEAERLAR